MSNHSRFNGLREQLLFRKLKARRRPWRFLPVYFSYHGEWIV